ncbi:hypothetical protein [Melittangium boletus]|uniref:hypothetical protein n=1 Tax=Melittangium boletus TaxID=83453 RepID=UPI003DA53EA1
MREMRLYLLALAGFVTGATAAPTPPEPPPTPAARDAAPQTAGQHPCDWVETCQLPCGGDGLECCHAEWNCPPDARSPRC